VLRILIADDHQIVRSGLKQIITGEEDLTVQGEAGNAPEVVSRLQQGNIDLLLTDLSMPGLSQFDLISRIRGAAPRLPILVFSMHDEAQMVARVLRAGATGYVIKASPVAILLAAIRKVAQGGRFIDPALIDSMIFEPLDEHPPHVALSNREFDVLKLCAAGMPLTEIGRRLRLSAKTISTYKTRVMEKLGLENNADLVRYALRHHLVTE
jgi:DNA-binding NarL/FixJ family response regulator